MRRREAFLIPLVQINDGEPWDDVQKERNKEHKGIPGEINNKCRKEQWLINRVISCHFSMTNIFLFQRVWSTYGAKYVHI